MRFETHASKLVAESQPAADAAACPTGCCWSFSRFRVSSCFHAAASQRSNPLLKSPLKSLFKPPSSQMALLSPLQASSRIENSQRGLEAPSEAPSRRLQLIELFKSFFKNAYLISLRTVPRQLDPCIQGHAPSQFGEGGPGFSKGGLRSPLPSGGGLCRRPRGVEGGLEKGLQGFFFWQVRASSAEKRLQGA